MIFSKRILILEDDLITLSKILERLAELEQDQPYEFCTITLSDYTQVQDYINANPKAGFDIILLDRDCKLGGSFHVLDIERFGVEKIIAISSVPKYNEEVQKKGVKRVVLKDYADLDNFADKVVREIEQMVRELPDELSTPRARLQRVAKHCGQVAPELLQVYGLTVGIAVVKYSYEEKGD